MPCLREPQLWWRGIDCDPLGARLKPLIPGPGTDPARRDRAKGAPILLLPPPSSCLTYFTTVVTKHHGQGRATYRRKSSLHSGLIVYKIRIHGLRGGEHDSRQASMAEVVLVGFFFPSVSLSLVCGCLTPCTWAEHHGGKYLHRRTAILIKQTGNRESKDGRG